MEEKGFIEVTLKGSIGGNPVTPADLDTAEIKEMITDVETFLYPGKAEKADRPRIAYDIKEGSAKHLFYLPISGVLLFNGLTSQIQERGNTDFLDFKRIAVIDKFQRQAKEKNFEFSFGSSLSPQKTLTITRQTNYISAAANYIDTEMLLYGKIDSEGGNKPNFHIATKEYGSLVVGATQKQLLEGEKRLYKVYDVKVSGKQNLADGKPFDLKLIDYIDYNPVFDKQELDVLINKAAGSWSDVQDVDAWLADLRCH